MVLAVIIIVAIIGIGIIIRENHKNREAQAFREKEEEYRELEIEALRKLGFQNWSIVAHTDEYVTVRSRQALEKYDDIKFFKENKDVLKKLRQLLE